MATSRKVSVYSRDGTPTPFAVWLRFLSGQTDSPRPITLLRRNKMSVLLRFAALPPRFCGT